MLFEILYDDKRYLVELEPLIKGRETKEVFKLLYNDDSDDGDEYEIKVFLEEGEQYILQKVLELPKDFQDFMGQGLQKVMPATFVANPFFDEVFVFYGNKILTSQDHFKAISCGQCGRNDLYETRLKKNKTAYIQDVQSKLRAKPHPEWPFKDNLLVQFTVSDTQSRLNEVDLDNVAKALFDSMKGVVFTDDSQIIRYAADKECVKGIIAYIVAIKRLAPGERAHFQEFIFSGRVNAWDKEYQQKNALGKSTRFTFY
jgi:Holliday junction resolvase RusA-like endonuclease